MSALFELAVDDPQTQRFQVALELLREGKPVTYRGVSLSLHEPGVLDCGVIMQCSPESATSDIARAEMLQGRESIEALVAASPEFASLVAGRRHRYSLLRWDGMTYIELACLDEET